MIGRPSFVVLLAIAASACGSPNARSPVAPTPGASGGTISAQAQQHLEQLLTLMQNNSVRRLTIDWPSFRNEVLSAAGAAQAIPDTFPAIRMALTRLGDGHSSYRSASGTTIFVPTRSCAGSAGASRPALPETIGYVSIGAFPGTPANASAFANNIQNVIRAADRDDLVGWIVDVRGNSGGNMWPMIAGVGPVLGEGVAGFFIAPTGTTSSWEYSGGAAISGTSVAHRVDAPYVLRRPQPRVAVLTDIGVASSGEATVIAFKQRPNTRSFGQATCGLSTANAPFPLADGAVLNLTTAIMADRTQTPYGDRVEPDEPGPQAVVRAVAWLQTGR